MPSVLMTDGNMLSADTWSELEAKLRSDPWNAVFSKMKFRKELALRAYVWSNTVTRRPRSSYHLFKQLERAGMLRIVEED